MVDIAKYAWSVICKCQLVVIDLKSWAYLDWVPAESDCTHLPETSGSVPMPCGPLVWSWALVPTGLRAHGFRLPGGAWQAH
eukprot:2144968-Lingulodinium_polyedra.AAC.1